MNMIPHTERDEKKTITLSRERERERERENVLR